MRALLCTDFGGFDRLTLAEVPAPTPGPGEVLIDVAAAGINFADLLMIGGQYQEKPPLPFTPGLEIAGVVRACGVGVTRVRPGDRVAAAVDRGGFAEQAVARARHPPQMIGGFLGAIRLRQHRAIVERERRIGADHGDAGKPRRNLDRFRLGERVGDVARRLAGGEQRGGKRLLVDMRRRCFEIEPGGAQHRGAAAALRGEEKGHALARSSTSLMTAAAVSSIERRVTSITGQPLSANMRRA